jgi:hypothetical protein
MTLKSSLAVLHKQSRTGDTFDVSSKVFERFVEVAVGGHELSRIDADTIVLVGTYAIIIPRFLGPLSLTIVPGFPVTGTFDINININDTNCTAS